MAHVDRLKIMLERNDNLKRGLSLRHRSYNDPQGPKHVQVLKCVRKVSDRSLIIRW